MTLTDVWHIGLGKRREPLHDGSEGLCRASGGGDLKTCHSPSEFGFTGHAPGPNQSGLCSAPAAVPAPAGCPRTVCLPPLVCGVLSLTQKQVRSPASPVVLGVVHLLRGGTVTAHACACDRGPVHELSPSEWECVTVGFAGGAVSDGRPASGTAPQAKAKGAAAPAHPYCPSRDRGTLPPCVLTASGPSWAPLSPGEAVGLCRGSLPSPHPHDLWAWGSSGMRIGDALPLLRRTWGWEGQAPLPPLTPDSACGRRGGADRGSGRLSPCAP